MKLPAVTSALLWLQLSLNVSSAATFFVAPGGSDANPGGEDRPWASARKAAQTAKAGDTVLFAPGIYEETATTKFAHSGTVTAPIIFKSATPHGAVIRYRGLLNASKMRIDAGREYITVRDFEITQSDDRKRGNTSDMLVHTEAHHTSIIGNRVHNAFEDGIKVSGNGLAGTGHVLIEGNTVYDIEHEGIDAVRMWSSVVRGNDVSAVRRVGIMLKGGIRSVLVHGNRVHSPGPGAGQGITLGGSSGARWAHDPYGYEAYNCYGFANIVEGPWKGAVQLRGAKDSGFFNNTIVGADRALSTAAGGKTEGAVGSERWFWTAAGPLPAGSDGSGQTVTGTPLNRNIFFKNNLVVAGSNPGAHATQFMANSLFGGDPKELTLGYNSYAGYGAPGRDARLVYPGSLAPESETAAMFSEEVRFVARDGDLHLRPDSPEIDSGETLIALPGFFGETLEIVTDFAGATRHGSWDRGALERQAGDSPVPAARSR